MKMKNKFESDYDEETPQSNNEELSQEEIEKVKDRNKGFHPAFFKSKKNGSWYAFRGMKGDGDANYQKVTDFDLVINAIVERFNPDANTWERSLQCYLTFTGHNGKMVHSQLFTLEPKECYSKTDLQIKIFGFAFRDTFFKNNDEVKTFFVYLDKLYKPKVVREYDHFGFIEFMGDKYYLARNVLICLPDKGENISSFLMAPDEDGHFPLPAYRNADGNYFISLNRDLDSAPVFDLGRIENGVYADDMELIAKFYEKGMVENYAQKFQGYIQEMIAGNKPELLDGYLVWAYMNFFLYYDTIYETFFHGVFMYLYGEPSAGKGKMAEIVLGYFGLSTVQSEGVPTLRSIENKLASHSHIPAWLDEFKPDDAPKLQYFNLWFEGKTRGTSSGADRRKNERKFTRTMLFFCSNYAIRNDDNQNHLRSRCVKILTSQKKRGEEKNYLWLAENKKLMQIFMLYKMEQAAELDKRLFRELLNAYKKRIKKEVQAQIAVRQAETGFNYEITDREIQSMAILNTVLHYTNNDLQNVLHYQTIREIEKQGNLSKELQSAAADYLFKNPLFTYSVNFLIESARTTGERDAMSEFLTWIEIARDSHLLFEKQHFGWFNSDSGQELRVFLPKIWKLYEKDTNGKTVNKNTIFHEFEQLAFKNELCSTYIKNSENKDVYGKGYRISVSKLDIRFFYAFNHEELIKKFVNKHNPAPQAETIPDNVKQLQPTTTTPKQATFWNQTQEAEF